MCRYGLCMYTERRQSSTDAHMHKEYKRAAVAAHKKTMPKESILLPEKVHLIFFFFPLRICRLFLCTLISLCCRLFSLLSVIPRPLTFSIRDVSGVTSRELIATGAPGFTCPNSQGEENKERWRT